MILCHNANTDLWTNYDLIVELNSCFNEGCRCISQMEWTPSKSLFSNTNDSIAKLTISFISSVSLWDRPCYYNVNLWQMPKNYNIK